MEKLHYMKPFVVHGKISGITEYIQHRQWEASHNHVITKFVQ